MTHLLSELIITAVLMALEDEEVLDVDETAHRLKQLVPLEPTSEHDIAQELIAEGIRRHAAIEFSGRTSLPVADKSGQQGV